MDNKIEVIIRLYNELEHKVWCLFNKNAVSASIVIDYSETLPKKKARMLREICKFRNRVLYTDRDYSDSSFSNYYKSWIDFLKEELEILKNTKD